MSHTTIWKSMSEADRVFPRHKEQGLQPASGDKRHIVSASRRGGLGGGKTRVVEVVHVQRGRTEPTEHRQRPTPWNTHAETWPEGFRAKSAPPSPQHKTPPAVAEPAKPTVHVMAMWEPTPQPPAEPIAQPVEPPVEAAIAEDRKSRISKPRAPKVTERRFADPFADDDSGANCIRCGYLVEPAREKRGLWTCSNCG